MKSTYPNPKLEIIRMSKIKRILFALLMIPIVILAIPIFLFFLVAGWLTLDKGLSEVEEL